ncbi:BgTH12-07431 [Blumeria graminis f. sp. triticale]|uniref:BgTH12-07431 n=1 Tax=Blumeria graminis f. sp. triticale TaxID=1689686 RepID=A0A9W4D2T1_BLUGR|nr:BgTH12-07431 [Blumeria graminis f. sp. triticale]
MSPQTISQKNRLTRPTNLAFLDWHWEEVSQLQKIERMKLNQYLVV